MKVFEYYDIREFQFRFGKGTGLNIYDIVRYGPLSYGPLYGDSHTLSVERYKSILILHSEDTKDDVLRLAKHLSKGHENKRIFPGFNDLFKLSIEVSTIPFKKYEPKEIYDTFTDHCRNIDTCFPLIILPRTPRGEYDSIYYRTKAVFLREEAPPQVFTSDLLKNEQNYRWSLLPTAIQIFTKMGGIPYTLDRGALGEVVYEDVAVFIVGLSISYHPLYKHRGVGFLVVFDQAGTWCFMDSTAILLRSEKGTIGKRISELLRKAIRSILEISKKRKNVLIIHYSGKEVGRVEEEAIANAIREAEELDKFLAVYILKIKESDIVINDTQSEHRTEGTKTGYPPIGLTLQLKPDLYLMFTSGYFTTSIDSIRANIRKGLSRARIISRHREIEPEKNELKLDNKALLATVFGLSRLSYNSVQNPLMSEPLTTRYSREIAWISLRLSELGVNLDAKSRIKKVMWFI
jgi:hypothetical protein